jgi:hypothetical protein
VTEIVQLTRYSVKDALRLVGSTGDRAESNPIALEASSTTWTAARAIRAWSVVRADALRVRGLSLQEVHVAKVEDSAGGDLSFASLKNRLSVDHDGQSSKHKGLHLDDCTVDTDEFLCV